MIELVDITKVFNQGKPNEFRAIHGINLTIEAGQVTCLQGPSGSGKTTLLSMIGCLSRPTSGRISLQGSNLSGLPERFMADIRRKTFGFVFQRFNLIQGLTVLENSMVPGYPLAPPYAQLKRSALRLLKQFNLGDKHDLKIEYLSGGEAQRVAICRALINDPEILIADEPTANLDTPLSLEFMQIIADLQQAGKTILIASHDPVVVGAPAIDRVITMHDGRVVLKDERRTSNEKSKR